MASALVFATAMHMRTASRVSLTGSGEIFYPLEAVNFSGAATSDNFNAMHFVFEARSEVFSFNLNEVGLLPVDSLIIDGSPIPEPSALSLLGLGLIGIFVGRRYKRVTD